MGRENKVRRAGIFVLSLNLRLGFLDGKANKNGWCAWVCAQSLSSVWLFVTPQTCKAPLSMGFSRQEYWSGLSFPPPGNLSNPGIEPPSPALADGFFTAEPSGKPILKDTHIERLNVPKWKDFACCPLDRRIHSTKRWTPMADSCQWMYGENHYNIVISLQLQFF